MEGTVQIAGAIDQQQGFLIAHAPIVPVLDGFCRGLWGQIWGQIEDQQPLQSGHALRNAFGPLFYPFDPSLSHGCFYARY